MKRALLEARSRSGGDEASCLSKAKALANILDDNGFSAATVADFGLGQWHMAALIAQVHDPGPQARTMVVRMLRDKEAARTTEGRGCSISGGSSALEAWLAGCRSRWERLVRNARSK